MVSFIDTPHLPFMCIRGARNNSGITIKSEEVEFITTNQCSGELTNFMVTEPWNSLHHTRKETANPGSVALPTAITITVLEQGRGIILEHNPTD